MSKASLKRSFFLLLFPSLLHATSLYIEGTSPAPMVHCNDVTIVHFDLPGQETDLYKELLPYIALPLTEETIFCIKKTIATFFQKRGRPLVFIDATPCEEHLHVHIQQATLGQIRTTQNTTICQQIRLCPGEPLDSDLLLQDLRWLSRNPFHEIDAIFTPGEKPYTADIELLSRDRFPVRGFASVDNTGVPSTGRTRYVAGVQASPSFSHLLTYQFSSGNSYRDFHSHFLTYTCPFSWRHLLDLYGAYQRIELAQGKSALASARYTIPVQTRAPWSVLELSFGFDYKYLNETFGIVNLTQFLASLRLGYIHGSHQLLLTTNLYGSPGDLTGPHGRESHFETFRRGASNRYLYINSSLYYQYSLPRCFLWTLNLRGQLASTNLLASEQFGLGGFNTVRGYNEVQIADDDALLFNTELRSPLIPLLDRFHLRNYDEGLQFLLFLDSGLSCTHRFKHTRTLTGLGPGIRYTIDPYLSLRLDWGINLNKLVHHHRFQSRLHFALLVSVW
jgi:hemolysin activation/secretion protein